MKFSWDDLGQLGRRVADTISDAADTVGKKTGEVVEVQKIKSQISTWQRMNEKDCRDMGKMLYDKYKNGETVDPVFAAVCEEIKSRMDDIRDAEKKIVEIRGNGFCRECQTPLAKGMAYCPTCGAKVEPEEDDFFEEEDIFEQDTIFEEETMEEAKPEAKSEETDSGEAAETGEAEALKEAVTATVTAEDEADQAKPDTEESLADQVDSLEGKEGEV